MLRRFAARRPRHPAHVWLMMAGLVALLFNGNTQYIGLPLSLDRVFIPLALMFLAIDMRRPALRLRGVHWLMLALVGWTVISMLRWGTFANTDTFFAFSDRMFFPFLLFCLGPILFDTPQRRDALLKVTVLIGLYLGFTAIAEMFFSSLVFPRYIMNSALGLQFGRARGPFIASESEGLMTAVCFFAGTLLATRSRGLWRWLAALCAVLSLVGNALSLTRAAWFGLAAGVVVAVLLAPGLRKWVAAGVIAVGAAGAVALTALPSLMDRFLDRSTTDRSVYDRLGSNDAAINLLGDLPLAGIGWHRFYPNGAEWSQLSDDYPTTTVTLEIHNILLSRAAELGIPALIVFLAIMLLGPVQGMWRNRGEGDLAGWRALGFATFTLWIVNGQFSPLAGAMPNYYVWLICGIASYDFLVRPRISAPAPGSTEGSTEGSDAADPALEPFIGRHARPGRLSTADRA